MMSGEPKNGAGDAPRPEGEAAAPEASEPSVSQWAENAPDAAFGFSAADDAAEAEAKLRAELEEMRGNMLRALAEAENVRRRAQRDVSDARQYAVTGFARDLLSVVDNFQRALQSVTSDEGLPQELKNLLDGVRMTERELTSVLERHGVSIVSPEGERFDPNRHQAMFEIENADVPSGTVLQVMQAGAVIGERTLRPAMVGVSKGGPKPGEAERAADQGSEAEPASEAQPTEPAQGEAG